MLISETHFPSKSHFSIPGYNTCHTDQPDCKSHGGTAVLIRSAITYSEIPRYAKPELQATIIHVKELQRNMKLASVYCPPKHNLEAANFNSFFQTLWPCFVAGGDFNSKHTVWGSRVTATKGANWTHFSAQTTAATYRQEPQLTGRQIQTNCLIAWTSSYQPASHPPTQTSSQAMTSHLNTPLL